MPNKTELGSKYLLLDTHVLIWLLNGSDQLNRKDYLKIVDAYAKHERVRVSSISVWELGMLVAKKRLSLSKDVSLWVKESFKGHGLFLEALSIDIMLESTQMGEGFHGDPADRLIITTAQMIDAAVMTADKKMIEYCRKKGIATVPIK